MSSRFAFIRVPARVLTPSLLAPVLLLAGVVLASPRALAAGAPVVTPLEYYSVGADNAIVHGVIDPNGAYTITWLDYGTATSYGQTTVLWPWELQGNEGPTWAATRLDALQCGTTYHYRIRSTNSFGTTQGDDRVVTTTACAPTSTAPAATTRAPTAIAATSATLSGTVSAGTASASVLFEWGRTTSYGSTATASPASVTAGATATSVSATLGGLACATTYNFRIRASSSAGTGMGANQTFTTMACTPAATAPTSVTGSAAGISQGAATLSGTVTPNGAATTPSFEYGATTAYGSSAAASPASIAATAGATGATASLSGLACNTTYHFRVKGVNAAGTGNGADRTFTTAACTPPTADCSAANVRCVPQEYATIQAAADATVPGDTVLVADGSYTGFVASRSGTATARITYKAAGSNVVISRPNSLNDGIQVKNASYVTIEGFKMADMPQFGVSARGATATSPMHGVIIRGNTSSGAGVTNFYASQVADSLLEDNIGSGSRAEHGMYVPNGGSDNTIIRGNVLFNNAINGLHMNGDTSVGGDGLHTGITIEENLIYDNPQNGINLDGVQSSTIRNNVIYGNARNGIRVYKIDAAAGPKSLAIMNNTILVPSTGGAAIKLTEDLGGHTLFNNILINDGSGGSIVMGTSAFKSDRNVFGGAAAPSFSVNGGSSMLSLASWRALAGGYDPNSIVASPSLLFVDASIHNYRLKAGSPAADAGVASFNGQAAPGIDFAGGARPRGAATDIGAFESF